MLIGVVYGSVRLFYAIVRDRVGDSRVSLSCNSGISCLICKRSWGLRVLVTWVMVGLVG